MKQESKFFKWKHFEGIIIKWLVRWYGRYALSYADLKEMAAERGLKIERSTICRWVHEYGAIDKSGQTLDWMLSRKRNTKAAKRFFKKSTVQQTC